MNRRSFVAAGFAAAISPRAATKRLLDQIRDGGYALDSTDSQPHAF